MAIRLPPKKKCPSSIASTSWLRWRRYLAGTGLAADLGEEADQRIAGRKPGQPVEQPERYAGLRLKASAAPRICSPIAMVQAALPMAAISCRCVMPPFVVGREVVRNVTVERAGKVRQDQRLKAERLDDVAQLVEIARRQMAARQQVHALRSARRVLGRRLNELSPTMRGDGLRPAVLECILEVGRRDVDDGDIARAPDGASRMSLI